MKVTKHKKSRRYVRFFKACFGFHEPFRVLLDGNFVHQSLQMREAVGGLKETIPKTLGGATKLFVTKCILTELRKLGEEFEGTVIAARRMDVARCSHGSILTASDCIKSMVGADNPEHFFVASQDAELRGYLRRVPGTALMFVHKSGLMIEPPSKKQQEFAKMSEAERAKMNARERKILEAREMRADEAKLDPVRVSRGASAGSTGSANAEDGGEGNASPSEGRTDGQVGGSRREDDDGTETMRSPGVEVNGSGKMGSLRKQTGRMMHAGSAELTAGGRIRKKRKGPNPLSIKKKSKKATPKILTAPLPKDSARQGEEGEKGTEENRPKKRRRRQRKSGKGEKEKVVVNENEAKIEGSAERGEGTPETGRKRPRKTENEDK